MAGLACRKGPWRLLKRFIVPLASALPRKLKKSKKSRVAQNYTSWPHRRLKASQTHQKSDPNGNINLRVRTGSSRNVEACLCPGPRPKPPAFSSLRPRPHPLPPLITIGALLLTPKHVRETASEKPKPGPRRLFQSPSRPRNRNQTPIQRNNLLAGGPEQRLGPAGCGYSRAER